MAKLRLLPIMALCSILFLSGCGIIFLGSDATEEDLINATGGYKDEIAYMAGTWDGNLYVNDFADFTFNAPEGWTHQSDSQLDNRDINSFYGLVAKGPQGSPSMVAVFDRLTQEEINEGCYVKFFIWDGLNSMAPIGGTAVYTK